MILNYVQAKKIAEEELYRFDSSKDLIISDDWSLKIESGWVFFYDLAKRGKHEVFAGNAPFIVNKHTGKLFHTGTAERIEYYIDDYEEKISGEKNIWTIRLAKELGFSKFIKFLKLSRSTLYFSKQLWQMLNSYPEVFMEGEIRKIFPLKNHFEEVGIKVIFEKKKNLSK